LLGSPGGNRSWLCSSYIILEEGFLTAATVAGISGIRLFSLGWNRESVA